jgi:hypothetical protein
VSFLSANKWPTSAITSVIALRKWQELKELSEKESWATNKSTPSPYIKEQNVETIKHMERTFDELISRLRFIIQHIKDLNTILRYIDSKGKCQS